jgi:hypothetical protein
VVSALGIRETSEVSTTDTDTSSVTATTATGSYQYTLPTEDESEDADTTGETEGDEPAVQDGPLALDFQTITIPAGETARLTATGGAGEISWTSSNEAVATVENGAVTAVAGGSATITAKAGEESVSCSVTVTGTAASTNTGSSNSSGTLSLNKTDFTMSSGDPDVTLKVKGTDSAVTWASGNTAVVTVSESGVVKRVGKGTTTVTATVDGQVLECIVRVAN